MSDTGGELITMPVSTSKQNDKPLNLNSMIQMTSFIQQQAERMDCNRDDMPLSQSEPQTPTVER